MTDSEHTEVQLKVLVRLDERLACAGETLPVKGHCDIDYYQLGDHEFELAEGLSYDLLLTHTGEGILASGLLTGHVKSSCDRCLGPMEFDLASEVDGYYVFKEPEEADDDLEYELIEDSKIDLGLALHSAMIMDTPYVLLCDEDCKGLCPHCGANLNEGPCSCQASTETVERKNPFAALANFKAED